MDKDAFSTCLRSDKTRDVVTAKHGARQPVQCRNAHAHGHPGQGHRAARERLDRIDPEAIETLQSGG
jgi:hypothetical protein